MACGEAQKVGAVDSRRNVPAIYVPGEPGGPGNPRGPWATNGQRCIGGQEGQKEELLNAVMSHRL